MQFGTVVGIIEAIIWDLEFAEILTDLGSGSFRDKYIPGRWHTMHELFSHECNRLLNANATIWNSIQTKGEQNISKLNDTVGSKLSQIQRFVRTMEIGTLSLERVCQDLIRPFRVID